MEPKIKTHSLGKLRIYLKSGDNIKSDSIRRKLFPKNVQKSIIEHAKKDGLMNASAYNTHMGFSNFERIQNYSLESGNTGITVCTELPKYIAFGIVCPLVFKGNYYTAIAGMVCWGCLLQN